VVSSALASAALSSNIGLGSVSFPTEANIPDLSSSDGLMGLSTSISRTSKCTSFGVEESWVETFEIATAGSPESNSTYGLAVIQQTPYYQAVSFLAMNVDAFGVSTVQSACYYLNGKHKEFYDVPNVLGGRVVTIAQYSCGQYRVRLEPNSNLALDVTAVDETDKTDTDDVPYVIIEYLIVCVCIIISFLCSHRALR
jgi:hypothetical protein